MLKPLDVLRLYPEHDSSLCGMYDSRAAAAGDRPFVMFKGRSWSRSEFRHAFMALARALTARGVTKGDRVGILAKNNLGHLLLLFACSRIGAILVPSNPEFGAAEARFVLEHAGVSAVACDSATLDVAREACQDLRPSPWFVLFDDGNCGVRNMFDLITEAPDVPLPAAGAPDDTCLIIYTSGSTGFPKGAMHSQRNFVTAGEANIARLWLQPDDRLLCILPLFHVNALFYTLAGTLAAGATIVVVERFSASSFWNIAVESGATQVNFIDAVGRILKARPRNEFRMEHRIRTVYGARPESQECFRNEFHIPNLINGFGMTEIPGLTCNPFDGPRKLASLGPVGRHPDPSRSWAQCRLVDESGNDVEIGETGELWVKHPIVMQGYFRDPEQTRGAFRDGWFMTGDLMKRDEDGYFYFVTRKKDIIRRRGENIAGAEIDRVIAECPGVVEVASIPVPAEMGDEEILAAVVKKPGANLTAEAIADWCAERLAAMKVPRFVLFLDELPHTPTHKIAKHILKADPTLKARAVDLRDKV